MSQAQKEVLEKLHAVLAEVLANRITSEGVTAADLSVARQFLKDNGIDSVPTKGSPLASLRDILPFPDAESIDAERKASFN